MMHGVAGASQSSGHDGGVDRRHDRATHCSGRVSRVKVQPELGKVDGLGWLGPG
jgi:hypothetical protein